MRPLDPLSLPLEGVQLIEASAGTGKTFTITELVLRLVLEQGLPIRQILVVTFTRAATAELAHRVRRRLRAALDHLERPEGEDGPLEALIGQAVERVGDPEQVALRAREALRTFDQAAISTIHGFCQRVLMESALASGAPLRFELLADEGAMRRELVRDLWLREVYQAPEPIVRALMEAGTDAIKGPYAFEAVLSRALGRRALRLLPPEVVAPSLGPAERALELAWEAAARSFQQQGRDLQRLMEQSRGLNRQSYKVSALAGWFEELEAWYAGGRPEHPPKCLDKLTREAVAGRTNRGASPLLHPLLEAQQDLVEARAQLDRHLEAHRLAAWRRVASLGPEELLRRKQLARQRSFDDLLGELDLALERHPGLAELVREQRPAALIDEFQDTDPVQWRIFHRVWPQGQLFLVGDPKQAIYAFRGADIQAYLRARHATAPEQRWTLMTNWRSDPALLRAVAALFQGLDDPFLLREVGFVDVQPRPEAQDRLAAPDGAALPALRLLVLPREGRLAQNRGEMAGSRGEELLPDIVAADLLGFLRSGAQIDGQPVGPGDCAVLVRKRAQGVAVQEALRALGLPSVLVSDDSVLDSDDARQLLAVLEAVLDPRDPRRLPLALASPYFGLPAEELDRIQREEQAAERQQSRFAAWSQRWTDRGFMSAFRMMLDEAGIPARLLSRVDGERRMTNLLHLGELLHEAAVQQHLGPAALLRWLADEIGRPPDQRNLRGGMGAELRLESDARAIHVVTMHRSKGLEYPVVWCPFLWQGASLHKPDRQWVRVTDPEDPDGLVLDLGSPEQERYIAIAEAEARAESMRLCYVALTRARHQLVLCWGGFQKAGASPLARLLFPQQGGDPEATSAWVEETDDADHLAALRSHPADPQVEVVEPPRGLLRWQGARERPPQLEASPRQRRYDETWRTSSFSSLASGREGAEVDRDHDQRAEGAQAPPIGPGRPVPLDLFARGPSAGHLLHEILEHADFPGAAGPDFGALVEERMRRYGLDPAEWGAPLTEALREVIAHPFDGSGLCLGWLDRARRLNEVEFLLPVADQPEALPLTASRLAQVLRRHGGPSVPPSYVERLARLDFAPLQGWLRGFIDLVFVYGDRWYVVDYKSNHLGPTAAHYAPAALLPAMAHHHYILQYHLYAAALHRMLRHRLPAYDPARHWGGVHYLFLRGMVPWSPPGNGVHSDAMSPALLEGLSEVLERSSP